MSRTIAEAFHIGQPRARTDIGHLREWLGKDPRTGEWHIPKQGDHPEAEWHGYQVDGLLVDVDLFRRLRARGQARGADGIADLVQALQLVSGKPFDQLRDQGWSWLLDGERLQDLIPCAIVDTAHIVVLDALQRGDLDLAREVSGDGVHGRAVRRSQPAGSRQGAGGAGSRRHGRRDAPRGRLRSARRPRAACRLAYAHQGDREEQPLGPTRAAAIEHIPEAACLLARPLPSCTALTFAAATLGSADP